MSPRRGRATGRVGGVQDRTGLGSDGMGVCWILNALDIGRRAFFQGHHVMGIVESDIGQGLISDSVGYRTCWILDTHSIGFKSAMS